MCVLVVDDEALILMSLEDMLLGAGFDVLTAHSATAAINMMQERPGHFTAVVTDLHMPGNLTGVELVEHVKKTYPLLPVIVSTGRPNAVTPEWVKRHKVTVFGKPYEPEVLIRTIGRLLDDAASASPG